MWEGVRTFVGGVVEDHIVEELSRMNPNLDRRQRKQLSELAKRASLLAAEGNVQKALTHLRTCLLLAVNGIQDPDDRMSVQSLISLLPYAKFEEPFVSSKVPDLTVAELHNELRDRFGVTCDQYRLLSPERGKALLQVLRFFATSAPIICPISWEPLTDAQGKLLADVVAIFEEDSQGNSVAESERSAVAVFHDVPVADDLEPLALYGRRETSFKFAESIFERIGELSVTALRTSAATFKRAIAALGRNRAGRRSAEAASRTLANITDRRLARRILAGDILVAPHLVESSAIVGRDSPSHRSNRLAPRLTTTKCRVEANFHSLDASNNANQCNTYGKSRWTVVPVCATAENAQKSKLLIRCHLFRGTALKLWFDHGNLSNPVTRSTIVTDDWCRLSRQIILPLAEK